MRSCLLCFLLSPVSAGLSGFFELLTYDIKSSMIPWEAYQMDYGLVSLYTAVAACDWEAPTDTNAAGGTMWSGKGCGAACKLLPAWIGAFTMYSPSDHVQAVAIASDSVVELGAVPEVRTQAFLAFRGTFVWDFVNNRRNSQSELVVSSFCQGCNVHRGFFRNFVALQSSIATMAHNINGRYPTWKWAIFGHSMGSALAKMSTLLLRLNHFKVEALYALGTPRLGNLAMAKEISTSVKFSVAINMVLDPIPHWPFRLYGYRNGGPMYAIFIDPVYLATLSAGDEPPTHYLYYKKFTGQDADYKMSTASPYLLAASHMEYFIGLDPLYLLTCGGMSDKFIKNNNAMVLFS